MDPRHAATVQAQLPATFEHVDQVHQHSALKLRPPRVQATSGIPGAALRIGRRREYEGQNFLQPISPERAPRKSGSTLVVQEKSE